MYFDKLYSVCSQHLRLSGETKLRETADKFLIIIFLTLHNLTLAVFLVQLFPQ